MFQWKGKQNKHGTDVFIIMCQSSVLWFSKTVFLNTRTVKPYSNIYIITTLYQYRLLTNMTIRIVFKSPT